MKQILISIHEEHIQPIIFGKKKIELRSWKPIELPCVVHVISIKKNDKKREVVLNFLLRKVYTIEEKKLLHCPNYQNYMLRLAYVNLQKAKKILFNGVNRGYGWLITDLNVHDQAIDISEYNLKSAPQKFVYLRGALN